jgi:hypothetical protein
MYGCTAPDAVKPPPRENAQWPLAEAARPGAPKYSFGFRATGSGPEHRRVVLTVQDASSGEAPQNLDGTPMELALPPLPLESGLLEYPRAIGVAAGEYETYAYRVYLVFGGIDVSPYQPALVEVLIGLGPSGAPSAEVTAGRKYTLPERGNLDGIVIRADDRGTRLYVNVPGPHGDPRFPLVYVYAIGPGATSANPLDILSPPQ